MKTLGKTLAVSGLLLALAACGGGGGGPVTITVAGKVVGTNNLPVNGVPVVISGRPSVITAADGTFSVAGVTAPYDATVVNATTKRSIVYKGLTRPDPTLLLVGSIPAPPERYPERYHLRWGLHPQPASQPHHQGGVCFG